MEVFSLPPLPGQWFVTLLCAPGEGGSEEQSQWSQCPPGLGTVCLVLLSWDSSGQDRAEMDVTARGSCCWLSPVFLQGREHRPVPSCSVCARWGLAEGRPGLCPAGSQMATGRLMSPRGKGTAVQRGFAFEEALALLQRRELGLALSLNASPPPRVVLF